MRLDSDDLARFGFRPAGEHAQVDADGGITLGPAASTRKYRVLTNDAGQIVLDPLTPIPEAEAWLWNDETVRASVTRALRQAAAGDFHDLGSFAKFSSADGERLDEEGRQDG